MFWRLSFISHLSCLFKNIHTNTRLFTNQCYTKVIVDDGVANIIMCHSDTKNSLSIKMMENLIEYLSIYGEEPDIRIVVLKAEGTVFSSGHNLKELTADQGPNQHRKIFNLASQLMYKIIDCSVPVIAQVDGVAAAAGCQLVAQCDLAFCSEQSQFLTPGANFGIFCSTPGISLARCVPKSVAMKMLLTGLPINAKEAQVAGLVTKACTNVEEEVKTTCEAIISKSRSVIQLGKKFYYTQINEEIKRAYELGEEVMVQNLNTTDGQEGINSFIGKRKPVWKHR